MPSFLESYEPNCVHTLIYEVEITNCLELLWNFLHIRNENPPGAKLTSKRRLVANLAVSYLDKVATSVGHPPLR